MRRLRSRRGQSMTEVVIIVALVAIATAGLVGFFGADMRHLFGASSDSLAGNTSSDSMGRTIAPAMVHRDLGTFGNNSEIGGGGMNTERSVNQGGR